MDRGVRSERGQTAAEYLGVLVVIGAIVVAILQSSPGKAIAGGLKTEVCRIAQGDCTAPPPGTGNNGPKIAGAPNSGPPIGDGLPVPGLPWDGSASLSLEGRPLTLGAGKAGAGLYVEGSVELSRTSCSLDADGKPQRTYAVNGTLKAGAKADLATAEVRKYAGRAINYSITTDEAGGRALEAGRVPAPGNPASIPVGTSLTLDNEFFKGHGGSLALRGFSGSSDVEQGTRLSSSVQRVDGNHLRIAVGDSKFVRNPSDFGVGPVFQSGGSEYASGLGRTIDIDLRDPQAVAAYKRFLASGSLPEPNDSGTIGNRRDSRTFDASGGHGGLGVNIGPLTVSTEGTTDERHVTETLNPDGTTTVTDYGRNNRVSVARETTVGPDKQTIKGSRYTLRLQGLDPRTVAVLQAGRGTPIKGGGAKDVSVTIDDKGLNELRGQAFEQLRRKAKDAGVRFTDAEIRKDLASKNSQLKPLLSKAGGGDLALRLIDAKTPGEALTALVLADGGNPDVLANDLLDFGRDTLEARGKDRDDLAEHPEVLPTSPPKYTRAVCDN